MSLGHPSFPILGAFSCSREAAVTFVMSVRPTVSMHQRGSTGRISLKFYIGDLTENLSMKSKFVYNLTKTSAIVH
jgi:hypothetical protein